MTVSDEFTNRMLSSLTYPNPPAGIAAILVNVGATEPIIIHVDLHDETPRTFTFDGGTVSWKTDSKPVVTLVSPLDSLLPKVPITPKEIVRASPQVMQYLNKNAIRKIQAIKEARSLLNFGLKEAKDIIDEICTEDRL